jgi:hypothetical protein
MKEIFRNWLATWLRTHRHEPAEFRTLRVASMPEGPKPKVIYQIGDDECVWEAAMLCPCSCNQVIRLSLVKDARPSWRIQEFKNGEVTLLPSVWRTIGCKSHFIIYRSRILWCTWDRREMDNETWW